MSEIEDTSPEAELLKVITPREVREIYVNLAEINLKLNGIRSLSKKIDDLTAHTRGRFDEIEKRLVELEHDRISRNSKWDLTRVVLDSAFVVFIALIGTEVFWKWI